MSPLPTPDLDERWFEALRLAKPHLGPLAFWRVVQHTVVMPCVPLGVHSSHPLIIRYITSPKPTIELVVSSFALSWTPAEQRELLLLGVVITHTWLSGEGTYNQLALHPAHKALAKRVGCCPMLYASPSDRWNNITMHGGSVERFLDADAPRCALCDRPLNSDDPPKGHTACQLYAKTVIAQSYLNDLRVTENN